MSDFDKLMYKQLDSHDSVSVTLTAVEIGHLSDILSFVNRLSSVILNEEMALTDDKRNKAKVEQYNNLNIASIILAQKFHQAVGVGIPEESEIN